MGHSLNGVTGYGLLVLDGEENEEEIVEYDPPEGVSVEMVGDLCLGEDVAIFYMVEKSGVSVVIDSEVPFDVEYISEFVTEYSDYTLPAVSPEIMAWFKKIQEENPLARKLGVLRVEYFG